VAALLAIVLLASALDLRLGAVWVATLVALWLVARRWRPAPALVFLGSAALLGWAAWTHRLAPPAPAPYENGWDAADGAPPAPAAPTGGAAWAARLADVTREELGLTARDIERRAAAVLGLARQAGAVRSRAPGEVAAVEAAARRLARTLGAAEFRDLEARRRQAAAYLEELGARLGRVHGETEAAELLRATDPAAMAAVSMRPVREDLEAAWAAVGRLLRALGGGPPAAATVAGARYEEAEGLLAREVRYTVTAAAPVSVLRIETAALRDVAPASAAVELEYARAGESSRPVATEPWIEVDPDAGAVAIVARWREPVSPIPVRPALRWLAFRRLIVPPLRGRPDTLVGFVVAVAGGPALAGAMAVTLPQPRTAALTVPTWALHHVSRPGARVVDERGETWMADGSDGGGPLAVELVPPTLLLRNRLFAAARGYIYRPNPAAFTGTGGLAALVLLLVRRPRRAPAAAGEAT
jgi:hypothetical protein